MGFRIPAVAISPWVRRGHVDHTIYGFESILKMIEYRFGLAPLTRRDRYARNIARSFDFEAKPRLDPPELPDARAGDVARVRSAARGPAEPAAFPLPVGAGGGTQAAARPGVPRVERLPRAARLPLQGGHRGTTFRHPSHITGH